MSKTLPPFDEPRTISYPISWPIWHFSTAEEAYAALAEAFPGPARERPYGNGSIAEWELDLRALKGLLHPALPAIIALREATQHEPASNDRIRWALQDGWWWYIHQQTLVAAETGYLWSRDAGRAQKSASATEILFESEIFNLLWGAWPDAPCLPMLGGNKAPEFAFFLRDVGSVGVEAKCVAPMNHDEADFAIRAARLADLALERLTTGKLHVWVEIDRTLVSGLELHDTDWLHGVQGLAEGALAAKEVMSHDGITATPLEPGMKFGSARRRPPPNSLTLEGWWGDHESPPPLEISGQQFWLSPAEAKVSVRDAWPNEPKRVVANLRRADAKHRDATFGFTCVRVRVPPFVSAPEEYLRDLWAQTVVPLRKAGELSRTDVVMLSMIFESRVHPTRIRRRYREGDFDATPAFFPTFVRGLVAPLSRTVPLDLLASLFNESGPPALDAGAV